MREFNKYSSYFENPTSWMSAVPSHWSIIKLKKVFKIVYRYPTYYGITYENNGVLEVRGEMLKGNGVIDVVNTKPRYISNKTSSEFPLTQLVEGDLVISVRGTMGKIGLVTRNLVGSNITANLLRLSPEKEEFNSNWLVWLLENKMFLDELENYTEQTTIKTITVPKLLSIEVAVPSIEEQNQIENFLNEKIPQIESLIHSKLNLIQLLEEQRQSMITEAVTKGLNPNVKMKDSGVEWIDEIPEHWESIRLKYLLKNGSEGIKIGPFGSALKLEMMVDSGNKVYGQENLIKNDFALGNRFLSSDKFEELKNYEIIEGDVLVSMMGTIGKCKVVPSNIIQGIMDSHLIRMRFNENRVIPDYIALVITEANYIKEQLNLKSKGSIMSGLNSSIIKSLNISLPSVEEQRKILDFLNKQENNLQDIINVTKIQIQKLKDYRQSLIYEAVTGKIDVRDFEVEA